jgi:PEP-CTERM motif
MKFVKNAAIAATVSALSLFSSFTSAATALGITNVIIQNSIPDFLQVAEVRAYDLSGAQISFTSAMTDLATTGYGTSASLAIDGNPNQSYPNIFHSSSVGTNPGVDDGYLDDVLRLSFGGGAYDLGRLEILGRGDCCQFRDVYTVFLVSDGGTTVQTVGIDSRSGGFGEIAFTSPVPEPGEWAMMLSGLAVVGAIARRRRKVAV